MLTKVLPNVYVDLSQVGGVQIDRQSGRGTQTITVTISSKAGGSLARKEIKAPHSNGQAMKDSEQLLKEMLKLLGAQE